MPDLPPTTPPAPFRFPYKRFVIPLIGVILVLAANLWMEYDDSGHISGVAVFSAILALIVFLAIVRLVAWWYERRQ